MENKHQYEVDVEWTDEEKELFLPAVLRKEIAAP
jgi:hypothetical protein